MNSTNVIDVKINNICHKKLFKQINIFHHRGYNETKNGSYLIREITTTVILMTPLTGIIDTKSNLSSN